MSLKNWTNSQLVRHLKSYRCDVALSTDYTGVPTDHLDEVLRRLEAKTKCGAHEPPRGSGTALKPIKQWTNGGLERALRNQVLNRLCNHIKGEKYVSIPKQFFNEVRRRLLGDHIQPNPYVRVHTLQNESEYPEFRGGREDQHFPRFSDGYHETTAQELNDLMITLRNRDDIIAHLKRELERRDDVIVDRNHTIGRCRAELHGLRQEHKADQMVLNARDMANKALRGDLEVERSHNRDLARDLDLAETHILRTANKNTKDRNLALASTLDHAEFRNRGLEAEIHKRDDLVSSLNRRLENVHSHSRAKEQEIVKLRGTLAHAAQRMTDPPVVFAARTIEYVTGRDEPGTYRIDEIRRDECSHCISAPLVKRYDAKIVVYGDSGLRNHILDGLNKED